MEELKHNKGLTLIEMLVVLAIIAVLATLGIGITVRIGKQAKERGVLETYALLDSALETYYESTGAFPVQPEVDFSKASAHITVMGKALYAVPASREILRQADSVWDKTGPETPQIRDPWGQVLDYHYAPDDHFPELTSAGPDKEFGTPDDISNKRGL